MSQLAIVFLGKFQVFLADNALTAFESDKVRALLAYLTVEATGANGQAMLHSRSALAALLWPGYSEESARASLRQTLYHLRKNLGDDQAITGQGNVDQASPFLLVSRQTIQLNPNADCRVDVRRFIDLLSACAAHPHEQIEQCRPCLQRLRQAVDLYQGDFLAGFSVADSDPFEEWRRITQEYLHIQALSALTRLANAAEAAGEVEQALQDARRQLALEPWREEAHRQIMRVLARRGQRAAAIGQYNTCRQVLTEELGADPDAETLMLVEQIHSGEFDKVTSDKVTLRLEAGARGARLVTLSPCHDWGEMPAVDFFAGRSAEVAQLTAWLMPEAGSDAPPARLVSLLGIGGIGKTTLAATVTKAVAPTYEVVIWRSLFNAPPLIEILRNWLQTLSRQTLTTLPESLDEQLRLLLEYLRRMRCLLVLDNVESIFHGNDTKNDTQSRAGVTRPGYEGYDSLFQRLAESNHQSCLLLTSREQPYALMRLGRQAQVASGRLRVLPLTGLDLEAGRTLLQSNGLQASSQDAVRLIHHYSGNPLALQIVAANIADFFGGDVAAFQQEEGGLFDGMRLVLDQQFARLSPLERDLLVWLAIERESVTVQTLRANFAPAAPMREFLEALQSLQNRSLLEKNDSGLTLQNVIIEYTTEYLVEQVCQEILDFGFWILDCGSSAQESKIQNPKSKIEPSLLNRFALLKAQAKEYVRQSQVRMIVQPLVERLLAKLGTEQGIQALQTILWQLHQPALPQPGYAAGNLLNLFLHLGCDLRGYDFSQLPVWQAYLRGANLYDVNFSKADLTGANFTKPFSFIWGLAYSPDGQTVAGGSLDGTIFLWQTSDGQIVYAYQGHTTLVYSLDFSLDGRLLASGSEDDTICVWDRQSHQLRYRLTEHSGFVNWVAFSPDGSLLASASDDRTVRIWDSATGRVVHVLEGHCARVNRVMFHPNGTLLASGSDDETIRLWNVTTGVLTQSWNAAAPIYALTFHPSGDLLMSGGRDKVIHCWDTQTGELRRVLPGHEKDVWTMAITHDGTRLVSSSEDATVRLWDVESGDCLRIIHGHQALVTGLAFSPDDKTLVSSSSDRTVCLWDTQTGQLLQSLSGYSSEVNALAFQVSGELLAASLDNDQVRIWDVHTGYPLHLLRGHRKAVHTIAFSQGQPLFVSGGDDSAVLLWDLQSGKQRWVCQEHQRGIVAVTISRDGLFAASYSGEGDVRIWQTDAAPSFPASLGASTSPLYRRIPCPVQRVSALAFSPDSALLAGGSEAGVYLWRVANGETVHRVSPTLGNVSLAFSPNGEILATGNADHSISLWSVATGELHHTLRNHRGTIYGVAFNRAGTLLASASGDHHLSLWDVQAGKLLHTCTGHQSRVLALAFHPDGRHIASGGFDGVVHYWDVQSGACVETFHAKGPYAGMKITGVTGISAAQKAALRALGAVEE